MRRCVQPALSHSRSLAPRPLWRPELTPHSTPRAAGATPSPDRPRRQQARPAARATSRARGGRQPVALVGRRASLFLSILALECCEQRLMKNVRRYPTTRRRRARRSTCALTPSLSSARFAASSLPRSADALALTLSPPLSLALLPSPSLFTPAGLGHLRGRRPPDDQGRRVRLVGLKLVQPALEPEWWVRRRWRKRREEEKVHIAVSGASSRSFPPSLPRSSRLTLSSHRLSSPSSSSPSSP